MAQISIPSTSPKIRIDAVTKTFEGRGSSKISALDRVSTDIADQEIVCLLGPSGCGKSTLLNIIAGFEQPTTGSVSINGKIMAGPGPDRAMVFQTPALFPWFTVQQNIVLGAKCRGVPHDVYLRSAAEFIAAIDLRGFEHNYPYQLSGGMRQRVSIARALLGRPEVLLLDEPFGALDAQTRLAMQELLLRIWDNFHPTIVFVTHDVEEAVFLASRVIVMTARPGRLREEVVVPIPRPRSYEVLTSDAFVATKKRLLRLMHDSH